MSVGGNRRNTRASTSSPTKLPKVPTEKLLCQSISELGRRTLDDDAGGLESAYLGFGTTLATRDDGASVTHAAARRSEMPAMKETTGLPPPTVLACLRNSAASSSRSRQSRQS